MIKDSVRTRAYRKAIIENPKIFKDKIVRKSFRTNLEKKLIKLYF